MEPFGTLSVCCGNTESASSMKCWRSFLYSARKSSRDCFRRSISSSSFCFSARAWRMTSRAFWSASLRMFSALVRASATSLSALCWATMSTWEIWRSEAVNSDWGTGAGADSTGAAMVVCSFSWATCAWAAASCCSEVVRRPFRSAIFWSMASTSEATWSRKTSTSSVL